MQGLDFYRSVCMIAIPHSDTILTICSEIIALLQTIIQVKYHGDISSIKKVFHTRAWFYSLICMATICYSGQISTIYRHMSNFLGRKGWLQNFKSISQTLRNYFAYIQTDRQTDMAKSMQHVTLITHIYTLWSLRFIFSVINFVANSKHSLPGINI